MRATIAGMLAVILACGTVVEANDAPRPSGLVNGDFSAGATGWEQAPSATAHGFKILPGPGRNGVGVTLTSPSTLLASDGGNIVQTIDAKGWRGRPVLLSGWIRSRKRTFVGLAMRVDAAQRTSFGGDTRNQPIPPDGQWHEVKLQGRVAGDADKIVVAITGEGAVDADFDDIALSVHAPDGPPPSPAASAYLDRAIDFIGRTHINAVGNANWPRLVTEARSDAAGAVTPADTYSAIEGLLGELHEHHAMLVTTRAQERSAAAAARNPPSVELQDGRIAVVTLTSVSIDGANGQARRYVDTVRDGIASIDRAPVCGWVVDLRPDSGGTTHVMAAAIQGLSGFSTTDWPDEYGDPSQFPPEVRWLFTLPAQHLRQGVKPVAILLGPKTASAGEDTALRFIGRQGALRIFGARTAGYTSANATLVLSDGAALAVPAGYMHDRAGKPFKEGIVPDEMSFEPMVAARAWLAGQCR